LTEISKAKDEILKSAKLLQETQSALYNQVYGRLDSSLKDHVNTLKSTTSEFESLKPEINDTMQLLSSIREEVSRLKEISSTVKVQDMQLIEHAKNIEKMDDEKLRLMREIDKLQDIIAKQRRNPVRRLNF
jgi:chromosome segregation ATPase